MNTCGENTAGDTNERGENTAGDTNERGENTSGIQMRVAKNNPGNKIITPISDLCACYGFVYLYADALSL